MQNSAYATKFLYMGDILIFRYPIPVLYEKLYIINKNSVNSTMIAVPLK